MSYNSKQLEDRYDTIIIGAGIGGLTCGCYLAKAGMKVLIVEQHDKPGGCCTSFKRKGITFDAAVHTLASCRENGLLGQVLDELDLRDRIKFIRMDPTDVIITKDYEIPLKQNLNETIDLLCNKFPKETSNIRDFFKYINSLNRESNFFEYQRQLNDKRFKDLLQYYFDNNDLISILSVLLLNTGVPSCEASALIGILIYKGLLDGGYYPVDCMQEFSNTFAKKFIEYGGNILFSTKAKKIEIEGGQIRGIWLRDNIYISAKYVISNCDARQTFFNLIGVEHLSLKFKKKIDGLLESLSFFTVYLGLNKFLSENKKKAGIIWYFPKRESEDVFSEVYYGKEPYLKEGVICNTSPKLNGMLNNNVCEVLYLSVAARYMNRKYWEENCEIIAHELINRAEEIFPGLLSAIEVRMIGTPYDIERFTLNYHGATNGWACTPEQVSNPVIRKNPRIKGLYLTGHWVNQVYTGGVPSVASIGQKTARMIQNNEHMLL